MARRRSKLQKTIIEFLKQRNEPVGLLKEIADSINAHPSSISRSIKSLIDDGLVVKDNLGYELSKSRVIRNMNIIDINKRMVGSLNAYHVPTPKSIIAIEKNLRRISEVTRRAFVPYNNLTSQISTQLSEITKVGDALQGILKTSTQFDNLNSLTDAIQRNMEVLKPMNELNALNDIIHSTSVVQQNLMSSLDNIEYINNMEQNFSESLKRSIESCSTGLHYISSTQLNAISDYKDSDLRYNLVNSIRSSTLNLENFMKTSLDISTKTLIPKLPEISTKIEAASIGFRDMGYTISTIAPLTTENDNDDVEDIYDYDIVRDDNNLDMLLSNIDVKYKDMRAGAWYSYNSQNPDNIRAASHSMRELIGHILRDLSPDIEVKNRLGLKNDDKITRKNRIQYIMNKASVEEIELVESYSDTMVKIIDFLNKTAHVKNFDDTLALEGVMRMAEDIIFLLLINKD